MFYFIRGELVLIEQNFAVIDAAGVGYKLTVSGHTPYRYESNKMSRKNKDAVANLSLGNIFNFFS